MDLLNSLPTRLAATATLSRRLSAAALPKNNFALPGLQVEEALWKGGRCCRQVLETPDYCIHLLAITTRRAVTWRLHGTSAGMLYLLQSNASVFLDGNAGLFPLEAGFSMVLPPCRVSWKLRLRRGYYLLYFFQGAISRVGFSPLARKTNLYDFQILRRLQQTEQPGSRIFKELAALPRSPVRPGIRNFRQNARVVAFVKRFIGSGQMEGRFVTIPEIAAASGIHADRLGELFVRVQGVTLRDYLLVVRMNAAHRLLKQASLSVELIAEQLGYNHASNFRRAFKKHFGYAPGAIPGVSFAEPPENDTNRTI